MTTKYVQKGLNNKQKKELRNQNLTDVLNSIDEIEFIKIDKEPYNPENIEHIKWCKRCEELGYSTVVWKHLDYNKINDAYENNLNYIAFYDQKSFENDEDIVWSLTKVRGVYIITPATN